MEPVHLLLLALGTWRLSSLLVREQGPGSIFTRIREALHVSIDEEGKPVSLAFHTSAIAELFMCVWCMSVWVGGANALLYALAPQVAFWFNLPLALSAVAIIVDQFLG